MKLEMATFYSIEYIIFETILEIRATACLLEAQWFKFIEYGKSTKNKYLV